jgi:prophage regulatory protein
MQDRATARTTGPLAVYEGECLLSIKAVIAITSLSRTSIFRKVRDGTFPKPVALGPRRRAFPESQIRAYVAALANPGS